MNPPPWLSDQATQFSAQVTPDYAAQAARQVTLPGGIPDAVTGTAATDGGQQAADQLDQALTAQLADQLVASWPSLDDQSQAAFKSALPTAMTAAAAAAGRLAFRVPTSGTEEPGAGTFLMPGRIGALLTRAFGTDAPVDALLRLTADALKRLQLGLDQILRVNDQATVEMLLGPNPDDDDPDMLASLQMLVDDLNGLADASQTDASPAAARSTKAPATGSGGLTIRIPSPWRQAIGPARDALRAQWGKSPSNSPAGNLAHALIQADYLRQFPQRKVLIDTRFRLPGNGRYLTPLDPLNPDPDAEAVLQALELGRTQPSQPDILDLTTRQVYEIKPLNQFLQGICQLFSNYLLPLNASLLTELIARQMLATLSPQTGLPAGWSNPTNVPASDLWTPGTEWTPVPFYPVPPDLYIWVVRPLPGLVLYKYVWRRRQITSVSDVDAAMTGLATDTAATMVLAATAASLRPGLTPADMGTILAQMAGLDLATFDSNAEALAALLPLPAGAGRAQLERDRPDRNSGHRPRRRPRGPRPRRRRSGHRRCWTHRYGGHPRRRARSCHRKLAQGRIVGAGCSPRFWIIGPVAGVLAVWAVARAPAYGWPGSPTGCRASIPARRTSLPWPSSPLVRIE